jgi:hypothetical protein
VLKKQNDPDDYFLSFSFSDLRTTSLPHKSHFPSSVMHGCFGASPPQIPHLGICAHLLSGFMANKIAG